MNMSNTFNIIETKNATIAGKSYNKFYTLKVVQKATVP